MKTVNVAEARVQLSALLDEAAVSHEEVTITRRGHPIAVVMSFDEYEALHETLFWLARRDPEEPSVELIKAAAERGEYPTVEQVQQDLMKAGILKEPV
ncbi:MAG: prevent-host-death family protein [Acidimicrobiales bacterium]|nr:MAG: prevent-host-death family protein [Acidimicrobiales bacterium]